MELGESREMVSGKPSRKQLHDIRLTNITGDLLGRRKEQTKQRVELSG